MSHTQNIYSPTHPCPSCGSHDLAVERWSDRKPCITCQGCDFEWDLDCNNTRELQLPCSHPHDCDTCPTIHRELKRAGIPLLIINDPKPTVTYGHLTPTKIQPISKDGSCDCGAIKSDTPHARWCSAYG